MQSRELHLLVNGNVVAETTVLSRDADALRVVRRLGSRVEWRSTLWLSIIVVVLITLVVMSVLFIRYMYSHDNHHTHDRSSQ